MSQNIIINPTLQTPEIKKTGVIIGNVFVPTMEIVGVIYRCGISGTTISVNSCGEFASYVWTGLVGLNGDGECKEIVKDQKTTTNSLDISGKITTSNVVAYWGDVQVIDTRSGAIEAIYRCNFTTGEVYKIRVDGYTVPEYTIMRDGYTRQTAFYWRNVIDTTNYNNNCHSITMNNSNTTGDNKAFWFMVNLTAGTGYTIGEYAEFDGKIWLFNESGSELTNNDDGSSSVDGVYTTDTLSYTPSTTGTYYVKAGAYSSSTGNMSVHIYPEPNI